MPFLAKAVRINACLILGKNTKTNSHLLHYALEIRFDDWAYEFRKIHWLFPIEIVEKIITIEELEVKD